MSSVQPLVWKNLFTDEGPSKKIEFAEISPYIEVLTPLPIYKGAFQIKISAEYKGSTISTILSHPVEGKFPGSKGWEILHPMFESAVLAHGIMLGILKREIGVDSISFIMQPPTSLPENSLVIKRPSSFSLCCIDLWCCCFGKMARYNTIGVSAKGIVGRSKASTFTHKGKPLLEVEINDSFDTIVACIINEKISAMPNADKNLLKDDPPPPGTQNGFAWDQLVSEDMTRELREQARAMRMFDYYRQANESRIQAEQRHMKDWGYRR